MNMNNLTLYSDANEKFKYKLTLEGAKIEETSSRLCLEFDSGENIYFKGKLDQHGNCIVSIQALKHFEGCGKAKIEVIADKTYFTIHEMPFIVKKKIDVKFNESNEDFGIEVEDKTPIINISFEKVFEKKEIKEVEEIKESKKEIVKEENKIDNNQLKNFNDFFKKD